LRDPVEGGEEGRAATGEDGEGETSLGPGRGNKNPVKSSDRVSERPTLRDQGITK